MIIPASLEPTLKQLRISVLTHLIKKMKLYASDETIGALVERYSDDKIIRSIKKANSTKLRYIAKRLIRFFIKK